MIRNRFSIVYSTNVSKNKTFILRDKNIQNKIIKEKKDKELLNRGDDVIYLNPNDPQRNGLTAQITRLNFKQPTGKARVLKITQTPRTTPTMGTQIHIPSEPATSYNIKIYKNKANKLSKKMRIVKNINRRDLLYKDAAYTIFHLLILHRLLIALSSYIVIFGNCLNYIVQKKQEKNLTFLILLKQ